MTDDTFDGDVYWDEYSEFYEGADDCTNSCVDGYTDDVIDEMSGESNEYFYAPCND